MGPLTVTWYTVPFKNRNLSDSNSTRTQNHLVRKRTFNHLAIWLSVRLRTKWFWIWVRLQSLNLQISHLLRARSSLTVRQLKSVDSLWNAYVTWQEHAVKNRKSWTFKRSIYRTWTNFSVFPFLLLLMAKSVHVCPQLDSEVSTWFPYTALSRLVNFFSKFTIAPPNKLRMLQASLIYKKEKKHVRSGC